MGAISLITSDVHECICWGELGGNVKLYGRELRIPVSALWDVRLETALGNSHVMSRRVDGCFTCEHCFIRHIDMHSLRYVELEQCSKQQCYIPLPELESETCTVRVHSIHLCSGDGALESQVTNPREYSLTVR